MHILSESTRNCFICKIYVHIYVCLKYVLMTSCFDMNKKKKYQ